MIFSELSLAEPLLRAIHEQGYKAPSPIQQKAIPVILKGSDLLASAQTGTGKTAGFTLPLLHQLMQKPKAKNNHTFALILAPTRELAAQVHENILQYGKYSGLRSAVVFGGVKINPQMMKLRSGVEILVATPGRLLDLYKQNAIRFEQIKTLILDEADRMLDMGFIHDIKRIIALLPTSRQNLLFSATFSEDIRKLAKELLNNPVEIDIAPRNTTATKVQQVIHPVDKARKAALLCHLIHKKQWQQALVFSRTKHGANKLVKLLASENIQTAAIHGNKSQSQRTKALNDFKDGKIRILVATDIAARGIDIDSLPLVVNFDLPQVAEDYVHRIGRTGRAGASGQAISLVCADEFSQLQDIEKLIKSSIKRIEIEDFEPNHNVPVSKSLSNFAAKKQTHKRPTPTKQVSKNNDSKKKFRR
ncbi:DEAD/DEAH box helicase [Legionella cardiaca]|uniref:DEAD/DEAH box helicase n=1 Tax=Legionella cardiaca TaxID=1071983 RepID=A0ABY8AMF8_9GAMM|nr:DEAD/DEAH box helicase [Legionella cardiaca]WED41835.1 DEAD/DEAH box helicase [Legionella cardiaca]